MPGQESPLLCNGAEGLLRPCKAWQQTLLCIPSRCTVLCRMVLYCVVLYVVRGVMVSCGMVWYGTAFFSLGIVSVSYRYSRRHLYRYRCRYRYRYQYRYRYGILSVLCCVVLFCVVLCCVVLCCVALLHCIVLYCIVLYCIVLYCIVSQTAKRRSSNKISSHQNGPPFTFITSHYDALHEVTLHYTTSWIRRDTCSVSQQLVGKGCHSDSASESAELEQPRAVAAVPAFQSYPQRR